MRGPTPRRWSNGARTTGRALGLALMVLATTAGACGRDVPDSIPTPDEIGAPPHPEASITEGLDATYAKLSRRDPDGTHCFSLLRLLPSGAAAIRTGCSADGPKAVADDPDTWTFPGGDGDYGFLDGRLFIRTTRWDPLAEETVIGTFELTYCDAQLTSSDPSSPYRIVRPWELVAGAPPPDDAPCAIEG